MREALFGPGVAQPGVHGLAGREGMPRQWAYRVGYNIAQRPRATEQTTFEQLRNLAALYDGIQLCERVYFDLIGRLELACCHARMLLAEGEDARAPSWRDPARRIEGCSNARPRAGPALAG